MLGVLQQRRAKTWSVPSIGLCCVTLAPDAVLRTTHEVTSDTIKKAFEHRIVLGKLFQTFLLPFREPFVDSTSAYRSRS